MAGHQLEKRGSQIVAEPSPEPLNSLHAEKLRLEQELKASQQRCETIEKELGQILHDGVCQELSAAACYLQCLQNELDGNRPDQVPKLMEQLSASLRNSVQATHTLSQRLRGKV